MKRNTAGQPVGTQMISAVDGSDFTGPVTVYVTADNGSQVVGATAAGLCAHKGKGYHSYIPTQAEWDHGHVAFTFCATGAVTVTVQGYPNNLPDDPADASAIATLFGAAATTAAAHTEALTEVLASLQNAVVTVASGGLTGTVTIYRPGTPQIPANLLRTIPMTRSAIDKPFSMNLVS